MATMTYDKIPDGFFTIMGVTIAQAVESLIKAGANIIGSNCGNGIINMIEIARQYKSLTNVPIIIQSNAGLPEMKIYASSSFDEFKIEDCLRAGATIDAFGSSPVRSK